MTPAEERIAELELRVFQLTNEIEFLVLANEGSRQRFTTINSKMKRYKWLVQHFYYMMDAEEKGTITVDRRRYLYLRGMKEVCALHSRDNFSGRVLPD